LVFNTSSDPFINERAVAIASGVSGTILRTASNQPGGLQAVFELPNGMLDITSKIYVNIFALLQHEFVSLTECDQTQHLATAARNVYWRENDTSIPAERTSLLPRLWIE
jgi:hypothetical protein